MNLVFCSSAVIRNKKDQILIMSRKNKKTFRNCCLWSRISRYDVCFTFVTYLFRLRSLSPRICLTFVSILRQICLTLCPFCLSFESIWSPFSQSCHFLVLLGGPFVSLVPPFASLSCYFRILFVCFLSS